MESAVEILKANHGFDSPEVWVDYAVRNEFKRVTATHIPHCPDCGSKAQSTLGQYVYYSTLIKLKTCICGLVFSDASIDPEVLNCHFEETYKDENYFEDRRGDIFDHLAGVISAHIPTCGSVLDVGGGMGHLMNEIAKTRKGVTAVVQDVSAISTKYAKERFGLETITGHMSELDPDRQYDVVVFSDSLYYESNLKSVLNLLPMIVKPDGAVVIRVPNRLHLIRTAQRFRSGIHQDRVKYFNPEHKYILSRKYLTARLSKLGFKVKAMPSPLLLPTKGIGRAVNKLSYFGAVVVNKLFGVIVSPAMILVARRT